MTMVASIWRCHVTRLVCRLDERGAAVLPPRDDVDVEVSCVAKYFSTTPFAGRQGDVVDSRRGRSESRAHYGRKRPVLSGVVVDDFLKLALELLDKLASFEVSTGHYGSHRTSTTCTAKIRPGARRDARGRRSRSASAAVPVIPTISRSRVSHV